MKILEKLKSFIHKSQNKTQIKRYVLISLFSYIYIFGMLYLMIDIWKFNKTLSFLLVYGFAYLFLYTVQLKYLFNTQHKNNKLFKFILSILLFYIMSNVFYNLFLFLNINYLVATVFTILLLFPIRFLVLRNIVYRS